MGSKAASRISLLSMLRGVFLPFTLFNVSMCCFDHEALLLYGFSVASERIVAKVPGVSMFIHFRKLRVL